MKNLLENLPTPSSGGGMVAIGNYGFRPLFEAAQQIPNRLKSYGAGSQTPVKTGSHIGKLWLKQFFPVTTVMISGNSLILQTRDLTPSAYVTVSETQGGGTLPLSEDERRYRELTRKHFVAGLSEAEQKELDALEIRLDAADESDPDLHSLSAKINHGYDHLRQELKHVNKVLDRLLAR